MKGRMPELPQRCFASPTKMSAPRLRVVTPEEFEGETSVSRSWPRRPNRSPAAYPMPTGPGLFLPQGYERGYRYPLLVWLPDSSRPIDLGRSMGRLSLRNYVAIEAATTLPDADEAMWQAIDHATAVTNIHPERIFLIGVCQGGTAALRLACRHATAIAGGVSLGGPFPLDEGSLGRLTPSAHTQRFGRCESLAHGHDYWACTDRRPAVPESLIQGGGTRWKVSCCLHYSAFF
jgi:hypothetical protein